MAQSTQRPAPPPARRYLRPPAPIFFPDTEEMPETGVHLELRTALYLLVRDFIGERGAVGCDQFVYWDPSNPRLCLAPDLIVRLGAEARPFPSWKTWERGAPHLGVEIVSEFDRGPVWSVKQERYRRAGFREVVRFDPENRERPLRLWDAFDGDLVERDLEGPDALLCDTLGLHWCVVGSARLGPMLRLARGTGGEQLLPTLEERVASADARVASADARVASANQRIAELEAELRRRS